MKLNHLNLTVSDAEAAADFLMTHFGMRKLAERGKNFIFLSDENDIVLALMKGKDATYPQNFHIGFIRPAKAEVDATYARLMEAGFSANPPSEMHGSYTFYIQAPGGFVVECMA